MVRPTVFIALIAILSITPPSIAINVTPTTESAPTSVIDDSAGAWMWHGMAAYDDVNLHGGSGHAGGSGSFGAYTFTGTGIDIFCVAGQSISVDGRAHKIGSVKVSIDGSLKAEARLYHPGDEYEVDAYSVSDLSPGVHVLQVEPDGGWVGVDYIALRQPAPAEGGTPVESSKAGNGPSSNEQPQTGNVPTAVQRGVNFGRPVSGVPTGMQIVLLAENGMLVTADPTGYKPLAASGNDLGGAQTYMVQSQGIGYVTLRSIVNNCYVCVNPADGALYAVAQTLDTSAASGQLFRWEINNDGSFCLRSRSNNMLLSIPQGKSGRKVLTAQATSVSDAARFMAYSQ